MLAVSVQVTNPHGLCGDKWLRSIWVQSEHPSRSITQRILILRQRLDQPHGRLVGIL